MGGSFAVLVAALGAAPVNYDLSLFTAARTGNGYVTTTPIAGLITSQTQTASYLELYPAAALATRFGTVSLEGAYRPQLIYALNTDLAAVDDPRGPPPRLLVLHRGNLGGNWHISKRTSLKFDESLTYGRTDFSPLLTNPGTTLLNPCLPPANLPYTPQSCKLILAYFGSTSSVGVSHSTPELELGGSASYSLAGGLDKLARSVLPLGRTGSVSGRAAYEVTRKDALTSNVSASVSTFDVVASETQRGGATKTVVGNALLGWRRSFSKATQGDVSAGISVSRFTGSTAPGNSGGVSYGPIAGLGVTHRPTLSRRQTLRYTARVSYTAAVDPYGAGAYSRVEGTLESDYSPDKWVSFNLRGTAARGITPFEFRNGLAQLEFTSWFHVDPHLSLGGGARTALLYAASGFASGSPGEPPPHYLFQWAAFLGVTIQQKGMF